MEGWMHKPEKKSDCSIPPAINQIIPTKTMTLCFNYLINADFHFLYKFYGNTVLTKIILRSEKVVTSLKTDATRQEEATRYLARLANILYVSNRAVKRLKFLIAINLKIS